MDTSQPLSVSDYLVAAHLDGERQEARIFLATAIDKDAILDQFAHRIQWQSTVTWNARRMAVEALRTQTFKALTLATQPWNQPPADPVMAALVGGIRDLGIDRLPWTRALRTWQARTMLMARIDAVGGPWPDVSDTVLTDTLERWLAPYLTGIMRLKDVDNRLFTDALTNHLTWRQRRQLEELAPTHITVPSGYRRPIDYSEPDPVLAVRIQEMFGASSTPAIAGGKMPLVLHLLSPAGRPAQITRDLAGFWDNSYPDVKKELKGRYPKHSWPDDPRTADPSQRIWRKKNEPHKTN